MTIRAIILAAGLNSRLRNYATDVPKCLLPIGSSTILGRQIDFLTKSGIEKKDIFVVSGHMESKIGKVHSNMLLNSKYRETDNAYSLHIALDHLQKMPHFQLQDQVLVFDCDLVYDENLISEVVKSEFRDLLITRKETLLDSSREEVVLLDETGRIKKISRFCDVATKISGKMASNEQFVYTGILKMSGSTAQKLDQVLCAKRSWTEWYTIAFAQLLDMAEFFSFTLSGASFCLDVDTKEDYEKVTDLLKEK